MKILICSVTAGEGHNSTAKAIRGAFTDIGAESYILDTYKYVAPMVGKLIADGYLFVSDKASKVFSAGYSMAERRRGGTGELSMARIFNSQYTDEMGEFIADYRPDAIMFTHPFAGLILDVLKQRGELTVPTVGILTDFHFHPYWEECRLCDYVVTPHSSLLYQARNKGFSDTAVLPFGIPINGKFANSIPKAEARESAGLDPKMKAVLIMGGSMGHGNMAATVKHLDRMYSPEEFQMICVNGNNEENFEKVAKYCRKKARRHIMNLGFANNVDVLMDAADMIITKPGGLTTSEALAKRLPMIIANPIPGLETRNTAFLQNQGTAMAVTKSTPLEELVFSLMGEAGQAKADAMRSCIDVLRKPDSARDVCRFVLGICKQ